VAQVFGVPFEVIPFKANRQGTPRRREKRYHVHAVPEKVQYEIRFPRVEGYTQAIRNRVTVDWSRVPPLVLLPDRIPPEVEMKGLSVNNQGRQSLSGPGQTSAPNLTEFRAKRRLQELVFDFARALTRGYVGQPQCGVPAHVLFPQLVPLSVVT
jgi:type III restriction enzyme